MPDTPQYPTARKRKSQAKSKANGANLGFEEKLWQTADKLRGHLDPADLRQARVAALDDKIELNRRMNETLEAIARALFKSWFVDFDPVRAKAEVRQPAGLDHETSVLFPGSFDETELGRIPKVWQVATVGDICEFSYGKALKAEDRLPGTAPVYGSNGQIGWHNLATIRGPGIVIGRKWNPGTIVWSQTDFYPIDTTFYAVAIGAIKSMAYIPCFGDTGLALSQRGFGCAGPEPQYGIYEQNPCPISSCPCRIRRQSYSIVGQDLWQ